jgi:hypothetical protein
VTLPKDPEDLLPRGRPTKYQEEFPAQAAKLCKLGATDRELADFFQVTESTLNLWKIKYPEFSESLKLGKDEADKRVEHSLFHRATGYSHPDVHVSNFQGAVTLTPIIKHYPPDSTACIFWLKNRKPEEWRDRIDIEANVRNVDVSAEPLPQEAWDELYGTGGRPN